jgi:hypothetical protein
MLKKIISFTILLFLSLVILSPVDIAYGKDLSDAFGKSDDDDSLLAKTGKKAGFDTSQRTIDPTIARLISIALSFLGVIFVVLMVYGGYIWMTAIGNQEQVSKAKNLIVAAIIGLIIVVVSYAITYFIFEKVANSLIE